MPAIIRPMARSVAVRLRHLADDAPVVHDQDAVGERQDLVELDRDQEDRLAGVAEGHQPAVDELDGADVHAARRLADQQQIRVPVELPREHDLLLVAAREGRRGKRPVRGPHVVLRRLAAKARRDRAPAQPEAAVVGRLVVVAEDGALAGAEGDDEAHPLAVLGHVGQSEPAHAPRRARSRWSVMSWPRHRIRPDFTGRDAGEGLEQLRLAVARDAGDAHDLASPHREADALDALHAEPVLDDEVGDLEDRVAGTGRRLVDAQADPAADHQLGELLRRGLGGGQGRDDPALAHHGHHVRDLADLAELVGDEDDGLALAPERAEDAEEVVRLLGREDGGRLVEDEDVGAAVERLQDLDALALADAEVADPRVQVHLEVVLAPEALELGARSRQARLEQEAALDAEHDVLDDRERLDQHEVLVHHADPRGERVLGAPDGRRLAAHEDLAPVREVVAVEDAHQGGLAGAVLADDAVDRARADRRARRRGWRGPRRTTCRCREAR